MLSDASGTFRSALQPDESGAPSLLLTDGAMVALGDGAGQLRAVVSMDKADTSSLVFLDDAGQSILPPGPGDTAP